MTGLQKLRIAAIRAAAMEATGEPCLVRAYDGDGGYIGISIEAGPYVIPCVVIGSRGGATISAGGRRRTYRDADFLIHAKKRARKNLQ